MNQIEDVHGDVEFQFLMITLHFVRCSLRMRKIGYL